LHRLQQQLRVRLLGWDSDLFNEYAPREEHVEVGAHCTAPGTRQESES
jgi:hypothetical protein